MQQRSFYVEIFLVSFCALLLEISYTRVISFKLYYYFTYLIIGLALLGFGAGGVFVAIAPGLRRRPLERILAVSALLGGLSVLLAYAVVARVPLSALQLVSSPWETLKLAGLSGALFSTFFAVGIFISALFSARSARIGRLYFADLVGAGLGCAAAVPLMWLLDPPACVFLAGAILSLTAVLLAGRHERVLRLCAIGQAGVLLLLLGNPGYRPVIVPDSGKPIHPATTDPSRVLLSRWSPIFRIDVIEVPERPDVRLIVHDGILGSGLHRFDGDLEKLERFDRDPRAFPFRVLGRPPGRVLIIGAAGGHEILASLHFRSAHVTAVELNPATVSLLTEVFPEYSGRLAERSDVTIVNDDGRSFLAHDSTRYDLIFFVAPDSYSAMNAATASAYVLSESYLYTVEMIVQSLEHLTADGVICMQFGEYLYQTRPNRTARYVGTARRALEALGARDASRHILVATSPSLIDLSSILVKRTPFGRDEVDRFLAATNSIKGSVPRFAWAARTDDGLVSGIIRSDESSLSALYDRYRYDVRPITDDSPFFYHFAPFRRALSAVTREDFVRDAEEGLGEFTLLTMLLIATGFALGFLLSPFFVIRETWRTLPRKIQSGLYFGAIGTGFMLFEISLIQKLTLFLGYPTYSLTVTLMSLLVFTGLGSLCTSFLHASRRRLLPALLACLVLLTLFYETGAPRLLESLLHLPLWARAPMVALLLAPLGLCLGAFLPLGVRTVAGLGVHPEVYVAWSWAINGFFSVVGAVATTILSMTVGFRWVLVLGLVAYALATAAISRIPEAAVRPEVAPAPPGG